MEVMRTGAERTALHIRGPRLSGRFVFEIASRLREEAHRSGCLLLVNDRVDVTLALDLPGTHLGRRSLPPASARALLGPGRILGLSVHGSQIHAGRMASRFMERDYTALRLAESKIAELDTGLIVPDEIVEGDWGELYPRFGWRMTMEPSGIDLLTAIKLEIL